MGKKNKRQIIKKTLVKHETSLFQKIRPFMFPLLFGIGASGAYLINANDLMNSVGFAGNSGIQITWVVQVCTYLCIIGLIVLGYQFESKIEEAGKNRA